MRESALARQTRDYLTWLQNQGFLWFTRLNSGCIYPIGKDGKKYKVELCPEGTADFEIVMLDSRGNSTVIFWETKARGKKITQAQSDFGILVCRLGGARYYFGESLEILAEALQARNPSIPMPE